MLGNLSVVDFIENFRLELKACQSLQEGMIIYGKYIQLIGYDSASYSFIPNLKLNVGANIAPIFIYTDLFPKSFLKHYEEDRFDQRDVTIRAIKENRLDSIIWYEIADSGYIQPEEREVLIIAREDHGIKNGISLPMINNHQGMAGFSIVSSANNHQFQLLRDESFKLLNILSEFFHDFIFAHFYPHIHCSFVPSKFSTFTEKEKIVLHSLLNGKTMKELGNSREPISQRYAEKVLMSLRKKFGGITTHQLIADITRLGLL